jgi:hypothetical protein
MKPRICVCCGEPIPESGNALSRNPNVCASCSSLADGMEESSIFHLAQPDPGHLRKQSAREATPPVQKDAVHAASGSRGF